MSFPDIAESAALPYRREFHSVPVGQSNEDHIDLTDIEEHDYTDGAPAAAIQLVLKERDKQERDEQELHEHGEGTMGRGEYGDDESELIPKFPLNDSSQTPELIHVTFQTLPTPSSQALQHARSHLPLPPCISLNICGGTLYQVVPVVSQSRGPVRASKGIEAPIGHVAILVMSPTGRTMVARCLRTLEGQALGRGCRFTRML